MDLKRFLVAFLFFQLPVFSYSSALASAIENTAENDNKFNRVSLLTGLPKPPYILEDGQSGLQLDIIKYAFACKNNRVSFNNIPLGRNITRLKVSQADGMITLPVDFEYPGIYVSNAYITYRNVAVSLADNHFDIDSFDDLAMMSVAAFQNAKKFLPQEYARAAEQAIEYREIADQSQQITMLFERSIEVIILDINILKYFLSKHKLALFDKEIVIHPLFEPQPYAIGFKSEQLKNTFEQGVDCIKTNGQYSEVFNTYGY